MEEYFAGAVEVRYYDALSPQVRAEHGQQMQQFEKLHWPYPVSLVDGEVISIGALSVYSLLEVVERIRRRRK